MVGRQIQPTSLLAFDTATASLSIALLHNEKIMAQFSLQTERNHSLKLVPAIQTIMNNDKQSIDLITVGIGPGSYTGIRVSVTAAKTLAWAWKKPVIGVSSLYALAMSGLEVAYQRKGLHENNDMKCNWVYPLIHARRGQVYTARFMLQRNISAAVNDRQAQGEQLHLFTQRRQNDGICLLSQVITDISTVLSGHEKEQATDVSMPHQIWFVGEIEPYAEQLSALQRHFGNRIQILGCSLYAHWIGRIGYDAYKQGLAIDPHHLQPNYTQITEAETKLKADH